MDERGLVLRHDAALPSATSLVAEERIRGSWWGHPKNKLIFDAFQRLDPEVLEVKLICGKVTLVGKNLWPAVLAVAEARDAWQVRGLSPASHEILEQIEHAIRSDELRVPAGVKKVREIVSDLERRLLVHAEDQHTEAGYHARVLKPWELWRLEKGVEKASIPKLARAYALLEAAIEGWAGATLPWHSPGPRRSRSTRLGSRGA